MTGPVAYRCMAPGCTEWYCLGYQFGKVKLCGGHGKEYERDEAGFILQLPTPVMPAQGRLL